MHTALQSLRANELGTTWQEKVAPLYPGRKVVHIKRALTVAALWRFAWTLLANSEMWLSEGGAKSGFG